jgi:broad specificity phosphatase PhoE
VRAVAEHRIYLVRHGETMWSRTGQHTSRTDVPLTERGREQAIALGRWIGDRQFGLVLTSPRSRAAETAQLAGYGDAIPDPDLREWEYGDFEGRTSDEIRHEIPDWTIWGGPWRDGETARQVARRADRVISRCLAPSVDGDCVLFSHGHLLRVLTARWLGLPAGRGALFALDTATIGVLGWEHDSRVVETWNESCDGELDP